MRKIDPEWELKIFDLLEGNLPEEEAKSVLSDIMLDDTLRGEYESMRAVYLESDLTIVHPDKSVLYKRRNGFWYLSGPVKYAIAASFAILLSAGMVYYSQYFHSNTADKGPVVKTKTGNAKLFPDKQVSRNHEQTQVTLTELPQTPNARRKLLNNNNIDTLQIRQISAMVEKAENQALVTDFSHIASASLASGMYEQSGESLGGDIAFDYIPYMRKRSLGYRLLSNTRIMLADLRLPELKMKADKRKNRIIPSLRLHLRSGDTEIMATLIE